jgi:hypothetical protein
MRRYLPFAFLLLTASALAQTTTATLTGIVMDPSGAAIGGASITASDIHNGTEQKTSSNSAGEYTLPFLRPGTYTLTTEASSFTKQVVNNLVLEINQTARIDIKLQLEGANQTVLVSTAGVLTNTETSSVGTVIENRTVVSMPLNGRQFYSLALLVPGVSPPVENSTLGFRGGLNIAGTSEVSNYFALDGFNNLDAANGSPSVRPSIDDIQEFKLLTGAYPAEFGHNYGGQVVVVTKSGSNSFHGTAYDFLRNQIFDARNYFTRPGQSNAYKRNDFGGAFGGPIVKDKTFFFFSYEGLRLRQAVVALGTVPTASMLVGNFAALPATTVLKTPAGYAPGAIANNVVNPAFFTSAQAQAYAVGQALLSYYPAPTATTPGGTAPASNYTLDETRTENADQYSLRIDQSFHRGDTLYATLQYFNDPTFEPSNTLCSSAVIPGFGCNTTYTGQLYGVGWSHVFSTSLVNGARIGFQRARGGRFNQDENINFNGRFGINAFTEELPGNMGLPRTTITSYSTLGGATNLPQDRRDNTYDFGDDLLWSAGKHSVKVGADFVHFSNNDLFVSAGRGAFTFSGTNGGPTTGYALADALLGLPAATTRVPTAPVSYVRENYFAAYAQDDWKITPRLTLNYGMRWENFSPPTDTRNNLSGFNVSTGIPFVVGQNGLSRFPWNHEYKDFGPRLGMAWQASGDGKTVVHAGFGLMYNAQVTENGLFPIITSYPLRTQATYTSNVSIPLSLANPFPATENPTSVPGVLAPGGFDPNYRPGSIYEYSTDIQREITAHTVLDVLYLGSVGQHMPNNVNLNQPPPGSATTAISQTLRPYPQWGNITYAQPEAHSAFNSLQIKLQRSYSGGLTFLTSYTYGRSLDDSPGIATADSSSSAIPQNSRNLDGDYGRSNFDIKHNFVASPIYDLPFGNGRRWLNSGWGSALAGGFQISSICTLQSGPPITPYYSGNISNTFNTTDRPNVSGNPNNGPKTVLKWFNTSVFSMPAGHQFGNAGRNIINGPGNKALSFAVARTLHIYEELNLQAKAEVFDSFNHPNFYLPNATADSAAFGQLTSAQDPREIQLSLRLSF